MTTAGQSPNDDIIEVRAVAAERLTFFSDAVIAIALTLLALDLPVPTGDTNGAMLRSALHHYSDYLAFAISFWVIRLHWSAHHSIFRYVPRLTHRLSGFTMLWLFMQVVTPFATRVITGTGAFQARYGFYAVVQIGADVVFALMLREVQREKLYSPAAPADLFRNAYLRDAELVGAFAVSIPVSFVTTYSWLCWIFVPLIVGVVRRFLRSGPDSPQPA